MQVLEFHIKPQICLIVQTKRENAYEPRLNLHHEICWCLPHEEQTMAPLLTNLLIITPQVPMELYESSGPLSYPAEVVGYHTSSADFV